MQSLSTSNPKNIIKHIRSHQHVSIRIKNTPESICAGSMLAAILKKEMIEYEIDISRTIKNDSKFRLYVDEGVFNGYGILFGHCDGLVDVENEGKRDIKRKKEKNKKNKYEEIESEEIYKNDDDVVNLCNKQEAKFYNEGNMDISRYHVLDKENLANIEDDRETNKENLTDLEDDSKINKDDHDKQNEGQNKKIKTINKDDLENNKEENAEQNGDWGNKIKMTENNEDDKENTNNESENQIKGKNIKNNNNIDREEIKIKPHKDAAYVYKNVNNKNAHKIKKSEINISTEEDDRKFFIVISGSNHSVDKQLCSSFLVYEMAKNMNYLTNLILWPISVILSKSSYNTNLVLNDDLDEEISNPTLYDEIYLQIKKNNIGKIDGVFAETSVYLPFIRTFNIYDSLMNDTKLLKKYKRIKKEKIMERLAKIGVSIKESLEPFDCISQQTRKQIESCLDKNTYLIRRLAYETRITAIENYYLIVYYMSRNKANLALLCLENKKYLDLKGAGTFYKKIVEMVKEYCGRIRKIGNVGLLFVDKKWMRGVKNEGVFLSEFYSMILSIHEKINLVVVCSRKNDALIVCESENVKLGDNIYGYAHVVCKKDVKRTIENLINDF